MIDQAAAAEGISRTEFILRSCQARARDVLVDRTLFSLTPEQTTALLADLEAREQSVAQAAEELTASAAVQAAWRQGGAAERDRVAALIDHQLDQLKRGGINAVVLTTLRRMVSEVEA